MEGALLVAKLFISECHLPTESALNDFRHSAYSLYRNKSCMQRLSSSSVWSILSVGAGNVLVLDDQ